MKCITLALFSVFLVSTGSCRSSRWRPADPERPNRLVCATGEILDLTLPAEGDVRILVKLDEACATAFGTGQTEMECVLPAAYPRTNFEGVLRSLETGKRVEVCGYWVREDVAGSVPVIRPITSIDLLP